MTPTSSHAALRITTSRQDVVFASSLLDFIFFHHFRPFEQILLTCENNAKRLLVIEKF